MNNGGKLVTFLEGKRLLAKFHWGRLWYRLKVVFSIKTLLVSPGNYFRKLVWHFTKRLRDSPCNQFGLLRQYAPQRPSRETFPRHYIARAELPGIALVTPSYNQGQYLERSIRSVLSQNYPYLEYAVVDGGSTDGSAQIIERYRDQFAYVVSEKDEGQADAIIKGFARTSRGDYGVFECRRSS